MAGLLDKFWGTFYKDPGKAADPYIQQIVPQAQQYYGNYANPQNILNDPGAFQNQQAEAYKQSPGYQFMLNQQLEAAQRAASAGGMAGSPQHMQQNMELASGLAAQDYNNWANRNLDYSRMGMHAADRFSDLNTNALAQQGQFAYNRANAKNQRFNDLISMLVKGAGFLF